MATKRDGNPFDDDFEEINSGELARIEQEKRLYKDRMVQSTKRSQIMIEESKQVAEKTEEELARQEESLYRTEANLDKIHTDIAVANRQLTSLKSIWGTIGNYFRKPVQPVQPSPQPSLAGSSKKVPSQDSKMDDTVKPGGRSSNNFDEMFSDSRDTDVIIDRNLDNMMAGLSELKGHALLMGDTLDRHDDIIDRVSYKAAEADKKVEDSGKRINKILR
eukprot:gene288-914_t